MRCSATLAALILATCLQYGTAADTELSLFGQAVVHTLVDKQSPERAYPEWRDKDAILGPPDGRPAKLMLHNGWNDWGSIIVDLGLEISRGELVITHSQNGAGNDKMTSVAAGGRLDRLVPLGSIGEPQQMTTTRIRFDVPVRFVRLKGYAGGGVEADSVWEFDSVEARFGPDDIRSLSNIKARLRDARGLLPSIRPFTQEVFADDLTRVKASLDQLARQVAETEEAVRIEGQAVVPELVKTVARMERRLSRTSKRLCRLQFHSLFGGQSRQMPQAALGWESSGRKIGPRSQLDLGDLRREGRVELARREYEAIQLLVQAGEKNLQNVTVDVSPLKSDGGDTLGTRGVWLGLVKTVNVAGEQWPDPIEPYAPFSLEKNKIQPVWIRIFAPEGTPAGVYHGTVTVSADNMPALTTHLRVRVRDFSLPVVGKMKTILGWTVGDLYRPVVLDHRHNPGGGPGVGAVTDAQYFLTRDGNIRIDWTEYDRVMQECFDRGLACFGIPWNGGDAGGLLPGRMHKKVTDEATGKQIDVSLNPLEGPTQRARCIQWLRQFAAHLREKGWLERAIVYIWDEPGDRFNDEILALGRAVREADPELRIMTVASPVEELYPVIDIFCPHVGAFKGDGLKAMQTAQAQGKELWWYNCGDPYPCPTYSIPHAGLIPRVMYWLNWKYGLPGNLYWAFCAWSNNPYAYPGADNQGDGMLLYPPLDGKPVISTRLEMIRDGIEDYEYFALLNQRIEALEGIAPAEILQKAKKLLEVPDEVAASVGQYTVDPDVLQAHRVKIAEMIERLSGR